MAQLSKTVPVTQADGFRITDLAAFKPKDQQCLLTEVKRIEKTTFPSSEAFDFDTELKKRNTKVTLAVVEGSESTEVVGYLVFLRMKRIVLLHKICVSAAYRQRGIAKAMVLLLRSRQEKDGADCIQLWRMWSAAVLLLAVVVTAVPQVNYPFNSQVPPVAHVGESFRFQFALTTFEPQSENLQYSLTDSPSWLSLDGATRTLWGSPGPNDAGSKTFTITAAGAAGAVATMQATMMTTASGGPAASVNVSDVLVKTGSLSGPSTLALLAAKPLDFKFPLSTFTDAGKPLSYYATLSDHTPLPSWIAFDGGSLHFSGTTPQLSTSPQTFDIVLIASDIPKYAEAWVTFSLVVSNHEFLFSPLKQTVSSPKGDAISFTALRSHLSLDGNQISDGDIQSVTADAPSWLSFDPRTFALTGTPPTGLMSQEVTVVAKDTYGDTANTTVHFSFVSPLFSGEIGQVNATVGKDFNYTLDRSIIGQDDETTSVEVGNAAKWFSYDSATLTIHGQIPTDTAPQDIQATLTAKSKDGSSHDSQTFNIHISAFDAKDPTAGTPSSSNENPVNSNAASGNDKAATEHFSKRTAITIGAVIGGVVLLTAILALAILLCRHRRQRKPKTSPRPEISRPITHSDEWEDIEDVASSPPRDLEKGEVRESRERTPEHPPQLALNLPVASPKHKKNISTGCSSLGDGEAKILEDFDRSSWGYKEEMGPSHNPYDSMKIPTEIARISRGMSMSQSSGTPTKRRRQTTPVYRNSYRSSGRPVNRRLTGLGYGRSPYSPSRSMSSWSTPRRPRDHTSFGSYSTRSTSVLSTTPSAFPQPPPARHTAQYMTATDKRRSIRVVSTFSDNVPDRRTLDERRQSYIKKRASNLSPFFAAGSRASSSSYKPPVIPSDPAPSSLVDAAASTSAAIVRPSEPIYQRDRKEFTGSLRTQSASTSLAYGSTRDEFPGSLRKQPTHRSFAPTYSSASSAGHVQKRERPNSWRRGISEGYPRPASRSNTGESVRSHSINYSLGTLRSSKIFEDAEMSESVYSVDFEADDDKLGEKETQFVLPPLRINHTRRSNRESRTSKRTSKALTLEPEHGGKENRYSGPGPTSTSNAPRRSHDKGKARARETLAASPSTSKRTTQIRHRRSPSHGAHSTTSQPSSSFSAARHSRKPSSSTTKSHNRDPSRTQSSAYPYFEAPPIPLPLNPRHSTSRPRSSKRLTHQHRTASSLLSRSQSGNITDYALQESPALAVLDPRHSVAVSVAHAQRSSARELLGGDSPTVGFGEMGALGLGLRVGGERRPLGKIGAENGAGDGGQGERLRVVEGKGRRPVSVEVREERGRRGWGSLRAVMRGGGSEAFL
ncbi:uncharacterized protein BDZ99DRAFT_531945 [Mytilinidion resinicola]|uniref:Dystroglycan-type cadherin-like domain-containing protein n=1 Tax=Mytilinidion resinicola TaxID=574789 RepID=A0A6A6YLW4_9PEZI|nr:uncharacterized protein BDZ99DRAFT_531945 [Mytilinidion resinicola]KAF2809528.1 hypothetical protein BDZ99DRAFT_531945 [Mytilinidion resinicola]